MKEPNIFFTYDGIDYVASPEIYPSTNNEVYIKLPTGEILHVVDGWLESYPPQPCKLEEVPLNEQPERMLVYCAKYAQPEPKKTNKEILEELKGILTKYDVAGIIFIHSIELSEDKTEVDGLSDWYLQIQANDCVHSCITIKDDSSVHLDTTNHGYSKDEKVLRSHGTLNMAKHISGWCENTFQFFNQISKELERKLIE